MKNLIIINGTMGVGKTAVSCELKKCLQKAVMLDGDWCWDMNPFVVTEETKAMVMNNIKYNLNSFIHCGEFENIIFCWVMHEESIMEDLLSGLDCELCRIYKISIVCSEEVLIEHIKMDIEKGIRDESVIDRSVPRLKNYMDMNTLKINVDNITPQETALMIEKILEESA